jgi:flagellar hook-associated protein 1 FlgK
MAGLTSSLITASNAMDAMEQAMGVIQNNVTNAGTPGYVTATPTLTARSFNPAEGGWGGVEFGGVSSSRNQAAEENVWNQNTLMGSATQQSSSLAALENIIGISGQSGIPSALTSLYSAFSAWSNAPQSATSQQQVLSAAQGLAQTFNQAASGMEQLQQQTDGQIQSTVSQINSLAGQIASYNQQIRTGGANDGGLQAQLYNTLETLSGVVNIQAKTESDGTVSVLLNGQVPLVLGTTQQQLTVGYSSNSNPTYPDASAHAQILTSAGDDVTQQAAGGQLGGLLSFRNSTLPAIIGDQSQQGSLNQLAQAVSDRVNQLLTSGQTADGSPGVALFSYHANSATSVASTLAVNANVTGSELAAANPGPPPVANGIASELAGLASPSNQADMIYGLSYTDFYSNVATGIGTQASSANSAKSTQADLLAQAQNLRAQASGVSLNEQAANLLQFQQAYEASAHVIDVINTTINYLLNGLGTS